MSSIMRIKSKNLNSSIRKWVRVKLIKNGMNHLALQDC